MRHQVVDARGTRIHCVEEGSGPLVLLVHGFPESWYSWRHQLPAIAAAGFRAVAIDVRGYGRSSAPHEVGAYGMLQHVSDNIGVVEALADPGSPAIIIGHDWGAPIAAHSALLRPDIFTAVAMLSVPYSPRAVGGPPKPSPSWADLSRTNLVTRSDLAWLVQAIDPQAAIVDGRMIVRDRLLSRPVSQGLAARRRVNMRYGQLRASAAGCEAAGP